MCFCSESLIQLLNNCLIKKYLCVKLSYPFPHAISGNCHIWHHLGLNGFSPSDCFYILTLCHTKKKFFLTFLLLPSSEQAPLVLDDQVIFCLTVSLDKLPANTLKAKVRNIYFHLKILAGMDETCSIIFPQNAQNYYYNV